MAGLNTANSVADYEVPEYLNNLNFKLDDRVVADSLMDIVQAIRNEDEIDLHGLQHLILQLIDSFRERREHRAAQRNRIVEHTKRKDRPDVADRVAFHTAKWLLPMDNLHFQGINTAVTLRRISEDRPHGRSAAPQYNTDLVPARRANIGPDTNPTISPSQAKEYLSIKRKSLETGSQVGQPSLPNNVAYKRPISTTAGREDPQTPPIKRQKSHHSRESSPASENTEISSRLSSIPACGSEGELSDEDEGNEKVARSGSVKPKVEIGEEHPESNDSDAVVKEVSMKSTTLKFNWVFSYPLGSDVYYVLYCDCKSPTLHRDPLGDGKVEVEAHFREIHGKELKSDQDIIKTYGLRVRTNSNPDVARKWVEKHNKEVLARWSMDN